MNHDEVKRRLLADPETRAAYEHPPLLLAIARAVVESRHALGLTQEDLAARLGTSQMQVWRIESAQANLTLDTLQKLQKVLGLAIQVRVEAPPEPELASSTTP